MVRTPLRRQRRARPPARLRCSTSARPGPRARPWAPPRSTAATSPSAPRCTRSSRRSSKPLSSRRGYAASMASATPHSWKRPSATTSPAGDASWASHGCDAPNAASSGCSRSAVSVAVSAPPARAAGWPTRPRTWSTACCRRCPTASGCSRCQSPSACCSPASPHCSARRCGFSPSGCLPTSGAVRAKSA
jgi:hypothetical protein